jgi:hypothetical protein
VTVIATGFDRAITGEAPLQRGAGVLQFPEKKRAVAGGGMMAAAPAAGLPASQVAPPRSAAPRPAATPRSATGTPEVSDMEIPTFIRRQMD